MSAWKILLTDGLAESGKKFLTSKNIDIIDKKGITAEELLECVEEYDALVVRGRTKVTKEVIKKAKNLKVIGRCGVGVDNIDLNAASEKDIVVVNAPTSTSTAVAEHTMALILSVMRQIPMADAGLKSNNWLKKSIKGNELDGKTLGVIGFGNIGSKVGKLAKVFGMEIIAFDVLLTDDEIEKRGANPVSFENLLAQANVITVHVPLTEKTKYLINAETINKMKDNVVIVCAARGGVINEKALYDALERGKVKGAGLDVFEVEPPTFTDLLCHPRVVTTPHLGGQTVESQARAAFDIASEVLACLEGEKPRWQVNK